MSMNIFTLISSISKAQEAGKTLDNPKIWSNRAQLTAAFVVLANAATMMLNASGFDVGISSADVNILASAFSMIAVYVANKLHVASNLIAGKPSK